MKKMEKINSDQYMQKDFGDYYIPKTKKMGCYLVQ